MPVNNVTANQSYQLPDPTNQLDYDVARLIAAINGIDTNVAALFASLSGKAATTHSHAISDVSGLQGALDGKIGTGSNLPISQVTNLQTNLDAKASLGGADFTGTVTGVQPSLGANNAQFATTQWVRGQGYLTAVPDGAVTTAKIGDSQVTTAKVADQAITPAKMNNAAAVSVLARSANSSGVRADIAAASNGGIFSRLADALGFHTLTALFDAVFGSTQDRYLRRGASGWEAAEINVGSMTLLGTITTTSGSSQSLNSLTLTDYKMLVAVFSGVSGSGSNYTISWGGDAVDFHTTGASGANVIVWQDLFTGVASSGYGDSNAGFSSGYTTASTSVTVTVSTGSFDAGSVRIYGVK